MAKKPSFQFYPGDWMKDPAVGMLTPASRGIWIDLICAIHEADDGGKITGTVGQLARLCRCSEAEMADFVRDISVTRHADVTECHGKVTVTCRRIARETQTRMAARDRQKRRRRKNAVTPDVTQKSRLLSSSSVSTSVKTEQKDAVSRHEFPDVDEPEQTAVPPEIERMSMQVFGSVPLALLGEWVRLYEPDWIRQAMLATDAAGKKAPRYTAAILQDWKRRGGPPRPASGGNGRVTAGSACGYRSDADKFGDG